MTIRMYLQYNYNWLFVFDTNWERSQHIPAPYTTAQRNRLIGIEASHSYHGRKWALEMSRMRPAVFATDAPQGLAAFTFTCNYMPLRACLLGSIIARGSESPPLVPPPWRDKDKRRIHSSRSLLVGTSLKFSNSTLLVVTGCSLVRSARLHAIVALCRSNTSTLGILSIECEYEIHMNIWATHWPNRWTTRNRNIELYFKYRESHSGALALQ